MINPAELLEYSRHWVQLDDIGVTCGLYPSTGAVLLKQRLCVVSKNSLSQLLNWASPSLLRGLPMESGVIVGHWPAQLSPAPSPPPSVTQICSISPLLVST